MLPRFVKLIQYPGIISRAHSQASHRVVKVSGFSGGVKCHRSPQKNEQPRIHSDRERGDEKDLWPGIMEPSGAILGLEAENNYLLPSPHSATMTKLVEDYKKAMQARVADDPTQVTTGGTLVDTAQLSQTPDAVDGSSIVMQDEVNEVDRFDLDMASFISKAGKEDMFNVNTNLFKLGDVVGTQSSVGMIVSKKERNYVILTPMGSFITVNPLWIRLHLPEFLESEVAKDMIEGTLSKDIMSRFKLGESVESALPLAAKLMGMIDMHASSFTMKHYRQLQNLAKKYQQPQANVEVKLIELARDFIGKEPAPHELVGLFRYIAKSNVEFSKCFDKRNMIVVNSKSRVALYNELLRLADRPDILKSFISKAAKLIKYRNQNFPTPRQRISNSHLGFSPRNLVPAEGHSELPSKDVKFDSVDKKIISGLWEFISTEKLSTVSPLLPLATAILKPLRYSYVCALDALEFLRDIGVARPWENPWFTDAPLAAPHQKESPVKDDCAAIRKDLGDTVIYTIDGPDAKEIDDGVSIEVLDKGRAWIHVHIADPTTIITPGSELDLHCQSHPTTVYTPDNTFSMLPKWVTHGNCSLSPGPSESKNVLTFSALLDSNGDILDSKIHPSTIRNTRPITYDQVNSALGFVPGSQDNSVSKDSVKDLSALSTFAFAHFKKRQADGCLFIESVNTSFKVNPHPLARTTNLAPDAPDYSDFHLTPEINYSIDKSLMRSSNNIVAECMVIAGRIAAQYFRKHKLPALYPTQQPPNLASHPELAQLLKLIAISKKPVSQNDFILLKDHLNYSVIDTVPAIHSSMGIRDGYVRVTSPLRRYLDMVLHWQLKHHLLNPTLPPLFSTESLASQYMAVHGTLVKMRLLERRTSRFWLLNYLARIETHCAKSPDSTKTEFPAIVSGHVQISKDRKPQAIYRGKLTKFIPERNEWLATLLPFEVPIHFITIGFPTPSKLRVNLEVDMIVHTLIPDMNAVKFCYIPESLPEEEE